MKIDDAINIEDLRRMARRRLPRIAFDYIEGGVEDERCLARNESSFTRYPLLPRYLVDVSKRDQSAMLFERKYACPFGIAPTGLAGLFRPGADLILAEAAAGADIPFVMSGASNASLEAAARAAPAHAWYQLYCARDPKISEDMIRRARDAGLGALVLTVDIPVNSKRERNLRNGFALPPRLKASTIAEALTHPAWLAEYLRHGMPQFENWAPYTTNGGGSNALLAAQTPATVTWRDLESFRRLWPRHLVIKGILHPLDAERAVQAGVDGIWVSNHGGRQLDQAPAPIDAFAAIRTVVGSRATLMLDGGVRRGADIVTALCLGAQFVFVGRATLYGAAAGGLPGVRRAIKILRDEIDRVMAQMGCPTLAQLDESCLMTRNPERAP
ncbi:MAG TPA: alpha-hydroxy acid oxidase [Candidatus Binataceae bacterium]|nr:alpha-hydroxy acid oxidase [Candidatus Binataceae bacterium]